MGHTLDSLSKRARLTPFSLQLEWLGENVPLLGELPNYFNPLLVRFALVYSIASHNLGGSQSRTILFRYPTVYLQHDSLLKYESNKSFWSNVPA